MKVLALALLVLCLSLPCCYTAYTGRAVALGFPVRSSSNWNQNHFNYRLDNVQRVASSAWCAGFLNANQWIEVSSLVPVTWTGVITQGRADYDNQWVKSFTVVYSDDGKIWKDVDGGKTFTGNTDRNSHVTNMFDTPVKARTLRIQPKTWNKHISMRFEALFTS